jgi:hypothetical protein
LQARGITRKVSLKRLSIKTKGAFWTDIKHTQSLYPSSTSRPRLLILSFTELVLSTRYQRHRQLSPEFLNLMRATVKLAPLFAQFASYCDASWPKPKTYVEAGVCSQRVFDMVNQTPVEQDGEFAEVVGDSKIRSM